MPTITIETLIAAPLGRVFDLARSIDLHLASNRSSSERVIAGRASGLVKVGDEVTWEAVHFGVKQRLQVRIVACEKHHYFEDVMLSGAFKSMRHRHAFHSDQGSTVMTDEFCFEAPMGIFGKLAEILFLEAYMRRFIQSKALHLKKVAESDAWMEYV
jgi:ligand-binding SRPBCC domain-containing protein